MRFAGIVVHFSLKKSPKIYEHANEYTILGSRQSDVRNSVAKKQQKKRD